MEKLILLVLFFTNMVVGQINFEKGYIIDNDNNKTDCWIKMEDWKNCPTYISYKVSESNQEVKTATIQQIKEFEVGDYHKYQKFKVKIDQSSLDYSKLSRKAEPEYIEKEVLLKVIVTGNATLFEYTEIGIKRFFYSLQNAMPTDLIYKKYIPYTVNGFENYNTVLENKMFTRQLYKDVNCNQQDIKNFSRVHYTTKELSDAFVAFNNCNATEGKIIAKDFRNKKGEDKINIKIKGGVNSTKFIETFHANYDTEKDYQTNLTYVFGAEIEYTLSFNKNKWSIFLEPMYNTNFQSEKTFSQTYSSIKNTYQSYVKFNSFMITTGVRYNMFLTDYIKLFVSPQFTVNLPKGTLDSPKIFYYQKEEFKDAKNLGLGIGAEVLDKFTMEVRYNSLNYSNSPVNDMQSKNLYLILSYKIFDNKK